MQEDDIAAPYLSGLLARQLEEVEDAEMLVSRVLFNSWQDKKYWLEAISDEVKDLQQTASETSGEKRNCFNFVSLLQVQVAKQMTMIP